MFVGRALYILGLAFVLFSSVLVVMSIFSKHGGETVVPLFALLNGLIAMGIGELVIDLNHRKKDEKK
ncbi:hypothetical protein PZE06_07790 [Robertmurraya sp. DFI.2.37]|jgi:dipeptide/tripeptide permease|uniref:hypothetical protein n=1 Tax=Robertmurraya sp. DFI.2.37 TaxID=3031819 RepID=UPI0012474175|nr:hypothetical protein [Robertmurraya sp. DFI.2.37]MDF1508084.1 hypothetical protein [Robertmurraya sp. DFI.2.37]